MDPSQEKWIVLKNGVGAIITLKRSCKIMEDRFTILMLYVNAMQYISMVCPLFRVLKRLSRLQTPAPYLQTLHFMYWYR